MRPWMWFLLWMVVTPPVFAGMTRYLVWCLEVMPLGTEAKETP